MYLPRAIVQTVFSSTKLILKTKSVSANSVGGSFLCSCKTLEVTISILDETAINLETNYTRSCYPRENNYFWDICLTVSFIYFFFPSMFIFMKGWKALCKQQDLISMWMVKSYLQMMTRDSFHKFHSETEL